MAKGSSKAARDALSATDWCGIEAATDDDLARQVSANPDAAPDLAPEINVRAIRHEAGMTQAQFSAAYDFSIRTVQEWERAPRSKRPGATLLRAIRRTRRAFEKLSQPPEGLRSSRRQSVTIIIGALPRIPTLRSLGMRANTKPAGGRRVPNEIRSPPLRSCLAREGHSCDHTRHSLGG